MNIGEMLIRITADASKVKKGTKQAEDSLLSLEGMAKRVGGALAGFFAAREIARFGVESVRAFAEAEAVWERLATAIDATGESFEGMRGEIELAADAMREATRFGDEDFAQALQTLVIQAGDVGKALSLMGLAADVAAAKGISLESAAELLGKALAGNTTQLGRLFPALKKSKDVFGDLQEIVKGMAERDAATLEGRLTQLNNAWGDFQEAVGGALAGTADLEGGVSSLTDVLQGATKWIEENSEAIGGLTKALTVAATPFAMAIAGWGLIFDATAKAGVALKDYIKDLKSLPQPPSAARVRMGLHGAIAEETTGLPTIAAGAANKQKVEVEEVAKAWQNLSNDLRDVNAEMRFGMSLQEGMADLLRASQNALAALARAGVDPVSQQVQALNRYIRQLQLLLTDVGRREIEIPVKAITRFELAPSVSPPAVADEALGTVGQVLDDVLGELRFAFEGLLRSLGPMAVVGEFLNGVFSALGPTIEALMIPIRNIGFLLGSTLVPILEILQPILNGVAKVFSFVIQGVGEFIKAIGKAINWLLPGNPANGMVKMGQSMIDLAKQTRKAIDAGEDMTKMMNGVTASVTNMPEIFDLIARRRAAGSDNFLTAQHTRAGAPTVVINNPPAGMDTTAVARQVVRAITDQRRRGGYGELDLALAGME